MRFNRAFRRILPEIGAACGVLRNAAYAGTDCEAEEEEGEVVRFVDLLEALADVLLGLREAPEGVAEVTEGEHSGPEDVDEAAACEADIWESMICGFSEFAWHVLKTMRGISRNSRSEKVRVSWP